jgi:hypothetical protein
MVPAYNCADYLRETLTSVLAQDPGREHMQIEVVDDHSSDDPKTVVDELGAGRIEYYRQAQNTGHVRNFNTCIDRARGRLIHILHGDDTVRDRFYQTMQQPFHDHPEIGAAFCRYLSIDADGNWVTIAPLEPEGRGILVNWLERIAVGQRLQPPTMVVRRMVYETLGGFDTRISKMGEDWEMWVRIAAHFPVWYEPEPLAAYRVHGSSLTAEASPTGGDLRELRTVIEINRETLPPELAKSISQKARETAATTAIRRAGRMVYAGRPSAARAQVREALRTSRSPAVFERLALFAALWLRYVARRIGRRFS